MSADVVFTAVVLLRFGLPLFIPRYPLPAIVACLLVDAADQTIFSAVTNDPLTGYQSYDKALDIFYLTIAYTSALRNWRDPIAFSVTRFLFYYRLVGVTLFELLDERWLLLVFPNTFEYFFIVYEAVRTRWNPARWSATALVGTAAGIWIFVKLPQEWWIHIAQLDFTDFMADHPGAWAVLAVLAAAVAVIAWTQRSRVPPADWPFTMDVNRHLPTFETTATGREPFFSSVLAEKAVLLALVSVIFAQILPDIRASALGVAFGVVALVVVNSAISQALRRHGRTWSNTGQQFGSMLVINLGIVALDAALGGGDDTPALATLFFTVLLSLLIALYDRFRDTRATVERGPGLAAELRAERDRRREASAALEAPRGVQPSSISEPPGWSASRRSSSWRVPRAARNSPGGWPSQGWLPGLARTGL